MKRSKIILFMGILLSCGIVLHAASNNRLAVKPKKLRKEAVKPKVKKEFQFIPGSVFL